MVDEKDCLFCKIVRGEVPAKKVYDDRVSFAFLDINPKNPGHTLVIPKKHYATLLDMPDDEAADYFRSVRKVAALVKSGVNAQGLSVSSSNGQAAGQVVAHVHFHVIPRFSNEGPPGLESILPSKRLDDKTMDQIAQAIGKASPAAQSSRPASHMEAAPKPKAPAEPKREKKAPAKQEAEESDEDGISFDF